MTIRGISFPFTKSATSLPARSVDEDTVEENIRRTLLTPLRSRVMRPGTGSRVFDFVFESTGPILRAQIDDEVRRAIGEGEPRAQVLLVGVNEQGRNDGARRVVVDITYKVNAEVRKTSVDFSG